MLISMSLFNDAIQVFRERVRVIEQGVNEVFMLLYQCCVEENQYEPFYNAAKLVEENYNEQVVERVKRYVFEWEDSKESYVGLIRYYNCGAEAEAHARDQQNQVVESIKQIEERREIAECGRIDFTQSKLEVEMIRDRLKSFSYYAERLPEITECLLADLQKLAKKNKCAEMVLGIGTVYHESITVFVRSIARELELFLEGELNKMEKESYRGLCEKLSISMGSLLENELDKTVGESYKEMKEELKKSEGETAKQEIAAILKRMEEERQNMRDIMEELFE